MKQVPLVFVVMSGKAKADNHAVFRTLLYQLPTVSAVESNVAGTAPGITRRGTGGLCF